MAGYVHNFCIAIENNNLAVQNNLQIGSNPNRLRLDCTQVIRWAYFVVQIEIELSARGRQNFQLPAGAALAAWKKGTPFEGPYITGVHRNAVQEVHLNKTKSVYS